MGSTKKDLEIVYNLQWKNVSSHGDDKANIVGMYDIPATTLNWETFKSYLLKNSGTTGDDVKVSYVSSEDKEFPIESQLDFQIALYSFRQRARNGDIITLKLDRIADQSRMGRIKRLRRSAEPRVEEEKIQVVVSENHTAAQPVQNDGPPDWFKKYMKGFKKEIIDEVTTSVVNCVSNMKTQSSIQFPCHHSRKSKEVCCKRPRKLPLPLLRSESNEKELLKSLKMEHKLDFKLEKLEQKTQKIKAKKLSLMRPNDSDINRNNSKSRPIGVPLSDMEFLMDASAVGHHESTIPHMSGGETYEQEWEIINTGDMHWTENTELRYAWGSEALKPVEKIVPCPKLKPGEKGIIMVYLEIPRKSGNYECYWHFYHEGRRFGHWLGCQVIVDPSPVKLPPTIKDRGDKKKHTTLPECLVPDNWSANPKKSEMGDLKHDHHSFKFRFVEELSGACEKLPNTTSSQLVKDDGVGEEIGNVSADLEGLKIYDTIVIHDSNSSSDSDNQSIVSIADSNSSANSAPSDEFVVVPMPECVKIENSEVKNLEIENVCIPVSSKIKIEKIVASEANENVEEAGTVFEGTSEPVCEFIEESRVITDGESQIEDNSVIPSYAYVTLNGEKVAVPKYLLHADYLATAEDAPGPTTFSSVSTVNLPTPATVTTSTTIAPSAPMFTSQEGKNEDVISLGSTITNLSEEKKANENVPVFSFVKQSNQNLIHSEHNKKNSFCSLNNSVHSNAEFALETANCPHNRLFVFPLNCPGFEVVYPPNSMPESLPPELNESIESNQSTKATDGNTEYPYAVVYTNDYNRSWGQCNNVNSENPYNHTWAGSPSAYSYSHTTPPRPAFTYEAVFQQSQNAHSFQGGSPNEAGIRSSSLNHRFSNYMKRRSFNHAKHCSGVRCQQPFFLNTSRGSNKTVGPPDTPELFNLNGREMYGYHMPPPRTPVGSTKSQSSLHTSPPNERQNNVPVRGNAERSTMHILPDTLVSGAVNAASSAINTARSVLNMFSPPARQEQGKWENGQWISSEAESPREKALQTLSEMGFWNRNLNATLLARYNDDLVRVISELLQ